MYAHTCIFMQMRAHARTFIHMHECAYMCTDMRAYADICIHVHAHPYTFMHIDAHVCTSMHIVLSEIRRKWQNTTEKLIKIQIFLHDRDYLQWNNFYNSNGNFFSSLIGIF